MDMLNQNEKSTIAGGMIKEKKYSGPLFSLEKLSRFNDRTKSITFVEAEGTYANLLSFCKIT